MTLPDHHLVLPLLMMVGALTACSPTLDWREVRPAGSAAQLMMPCRPTVQVRSLQLAGKAVQMSLWTCDAGAQTWALAHADVADPALVNAALGALQAAAAANMGSTESQRLPLQIPGATPYAASQREAGRGRLPNGRFVQTQNAFFARGTVVFQATVFGESVSPEGADTFFAGLRLTP